MGTYGPLSLFSLAADADLAGRVCERLGQAPGWHEERDFEDGEHKIRPLESVRGRDVYVVQSLYADDRMTVNDRLCRTLFFLGALRDAGARRLTAVIPYLAYARKDRRTKARDPVTTRYLAQLLEAVGVDRMVGLDVHNQAAFQNSFRVPTEHLTATGMFAAELAPRLGGRGAVVVSPDAGGVKRADKLRQVLEQQLGHAVGSAFLEKYRSEGEVTGGAVVGEVGDRVAVVIDDLIASGTTLLRAARACREQGAREVHAAVTHGLFVGHANRLLRSAELDSLLVLDTIPPHRLDPDLVGERVRLLDCTPLLAAAIRRLHEDGSIVDLTEP